jgi:hypothetical protein
MREMISVLEIHGTDDTSVLYDQTFLWNGCRANTVVRFDTVVGMSIGREAIR